MTYQQILNAADKAGELEIDDNVFLLNSSEALGQGYRPESEYLLIDRDGYCYDVNNASCLEALDEDEAFLRCTTP